MKIIPWGPAGVSGDGARGRREGENKRERNSYLTGRLLFILIGACGINFFHFELENLMDFNTETPSSKDDFIHKALS